MTRDEDIIKEINESDMSEESKAALIDIINAIKERFSTDKGYRLPLD